MSAATGTKKAGILEIGTVIADKWVILEFIGKGAMGEVYRAHQINLQRDVAIKVVSREWLHSFDEDDQEVETSLQRFGREVQAMAQIRHPNVLQVYDHGTIPPSENTGNRTVEFIAMEFIPGHSLRYTMSEEGFYPEDGLLVEWLKRYYIPVLNGVEAVHLLDVVHRDVKPENILLDGDIPKIADFGLARSKRMRPVTQSMDMKGTLHYMSPEHFFDFRKADQRADIYSLGKILFEAVNGKFTDKTTPFHQVSLPEAESDFFRDINQIIIEATAEKIADRIDTVAQFRSRIQKAIKDAELASSSGAVSNAQQTGFWHRPRWIWGGVSVALISMAAMTAWHLMGEPGGSIQKHQPPVITAEKAVPMGRRERPVDGSASAQEQTPTESKNTAFPENGAVLRSIPGGRISLPAVGSSDSGNTTKVAPFKIEEAPVTNHQYIEFLNSQLSTLTVARGVVREDNEIWLLLGEIFDGYEPIVFRRGRFHLINAGYASHPVLRVTPFGAYAYATYYGRRLPTRAEWYMAMGEKTTSTRQPASAESIDHESANLDTTDMEQMHAKMLKGNQPEDDSSATPLKKKPEPITSMRINEYGIRQMGAGFGEWTLKEMGETTAANLQDEDFILLPENVPRKPWEAFEAVGFRCVKPVVNPNENLQQFSGLSTVKKSPDEGRTEK